MELESSVMAVSMTADSSVEAGEGCFGAGDSPNEYEYCARRKSLGGEGEGEGGEGGESEPLPSLSRLGGSPS